MLREIVRDLIALRGISKVDKIKEYIINIIRDFVKGANFTYMHVRKIYLMHNYLIMIKRRTGMLPLNQNNLIT